MILIVDDNADFRTLLTELCERAGYACVEAGTSAEALSVAARQRPDAALVDVDLGETSGYEVCRELRNRYGEGLPIIFVSGSRTDTFDRVAGLQLGADDYVTKPFDSEELIARVRRALVRSKVPARSGRPERFRLTAREREILGLLADGLGTVAISARLGISAKTVSTHTQRLLAKLGVHSRMEAVSLAYREGLIDRATASPA